MKRDTEPCGCEGSRQPQDPHWTDSAELLIAHPDVSDPSAADTGVWPAIRTDPPYEDKKKHIPLGPLPGILNPPQEPTCDSVDSS